jgi:hypothetical protein
MEKTKPVAKQSGSQPEIRHGEENVIVIKLEDVILSGLSKLP